MNSIEKIEKIKTEINKLPKFPYTGLSKDELEQLYINRRRLKQKIHEINSYERLKLVRKEVIVCECGSSIKNANKYEHYKTIKHSNFLLNKNTKTI